ncbi:cupin domain-containing protein [Deltaproteobacteria bacterium OttesenSCG-928-K17]|nr:cupin domain-containing protein [Deltaproteobacteria bacterium OttesenSCG-928-K17]
MIFFGKDRAASVREKAQGGEGEIHGLHNLKVDNRPEQTHFKMFATMRLPAGSSIGVHVHADDEEIYFINSGQGLFTDNDGSTHAVSAGDMTLTRRGERHGLANTGGEDLVFTAVIASE